MGTAVSIFDAPAPGGLQTVKRESKLADKMGSGTGLRRISTNTNGTFKRIVNGEQIGKAVPHAVDVIIVDLLKEVSRTYYAGKYDPSATPTLPDCWANDGEVPEKNVPNRQSETCATCPQNIAGSGEGDRKACRFQRRVAVLIAGDPSGEVYQMSFAAMSLFGKGQGNTHPFESYKNFLRANGEALDTVVTKVMYDLDANTMTLKFKAVRHLTPEEAELVDRAQADPETRKYVELTVAAADGAAKTPAAAPAVTSAAPVAVSDPFAEEEEEDEQAPDAPAATINPFGGDEEEETVEVAEEAPAPVAPKKRAAPKKLEMVEPTERSQKLTSILAAWGDDEDEG